jgi:predicted nucleic acid-binding Zn ribbon protein
MFGLISTKKDYPELGGEIHQDRKRRERNAIIIFIVLALIILNLVLYWMAIAG